MRISLVSLLCLLIVYQTFAQKVVYVDSSAAGLNDGSSWVTAFKSLDDGLAAVRENNDDDSVLIAKGTYKPSRMPRGLAFTGDTRDFAFHFPASVNICGGYPFGGGGRDARVNQTILSGDINVPGQIDDNAYHVVICQRSEGYIDGLFIVNGNANGNGSLIFGGRPIPRSSGGGLLQDISILHTTRIVFENNLAISGAGFRSIQSNVYMMDCVFSKGVAEMEGGAIYNDSASSLNIVNSVFESNKALYGGAIFSAMKTHATILHSTFSRNIANVYGGAVYNLNVSQCSVVYSVFSQNNNGYPFDETTASNDIEEHSEIDGQVHTYVQISSMQNFRGLNCVYGINSHLADPLDPDGIDNIWGTADDGLRLTAGSPGFNMGVNGLLYDEDITGIARDLQGKFDLGAYEVNPGAVIRTRTVYVDSAYKGPESGNSWLEPVTTLQAAINLAVAGFADTVKVAKGTYYPETTPRNWDARANYLPYAFRTFHLPDNVVLMGGYSSGGISRDPKLYPAILDNPGSQIASYYQIITVLESNNIVFDGFTVRNGNTEASDSVLVNGIGYRRNAGGGMLVYNSNIVIRNCSFLNNYATYFGGAIYAQTSKLTIENSSFENNKAYYAFLTSGGALYMTNMRDGSSIKGSTFQKNSSSSLGGAIGLKDNLFPIKMDSCKFVENFTDLSGGNIVGGGAISVGDFSTINIANSLFEGNSSYLGGAINFGGTVRNIVSSCVFIKNSATYQGGAIYNHATTDLNVANCLFYNNSAERGGAIQNDQTTNLYFCTLFKNRATLVGGGMNSPASSSATGSIFWANEVNGVVGSDTGPEGFSLSFYNAVQATGIARPHDIQGIYPEFRDTTNLIGPDNVWGTSDDGLQLKVNSPLINEVRYQPGRDLYAPEFGVTDLKKDVRIQDGRGEIGAYETNYCEMANFSNRSVFVDSSVIGGNGTGNSWQNAVKTLEAAFKIIRSTCEVDTIKVAKGTYRATASRDYGEYNSTGTTFDLIVPDSTVLQGGFQSGGGVRDIAHNPTKITAYNFAMYLENVNKVELDGFTFNVLGISSSKSKYVVRNSIFTGIRGVNQPLHAFQCEGKFVNCLFQNNKGIDLTGAAWDDNSKISYNNCVFADNYINQIAASAVIGYGNSVDSFTNCTFFRNWTQLGGSIMGDSPQSEVYVKNSIFWRNRAAIVYGDSSLAEITMPSNTYSTKLHISHSLFEFIPQRYPTDSNSLYAIYPEFVDTTSIEGADGFWGTADDGLSLKPESPAYNKGSNGLLSAGIATDATLQNRIANATVDIGAYELACPYADQISNKLVPYNSKEVSLQTLIGCGTFKYLESQVSPSKFIASIDANGNILTISSLSVDATTNLANFKTNGIDTTAISDRIVSIVAPGNYVKNGGTTVRLYYDPVEFESLPKASRNWFKHPAHTKAGVLADLQVNGLANSVILHPSMFGTENGVAYVEFQDIKSYSSFGLLASTIGGALPVKFLSFDAERVNKENKSALTWKTAWEMNNSRFDIERSPDGSDWQVIATQNGKGSFSDESDYSYVDNSPNFPVSYYRIKQVDIDAKFDYSAIRSVQFAAIANNSFVVGPNPASTMILIQFEKMQESTSYELTDMGGRRLKIGKAFKQKALNVDVSELKNGIYVLKLNNETRKIVINR